MKKLLLCFLISFGCFAQIQVGFDIDGEAFQDNSGTSVSMSADGNIIAIGATNNDGNGLNCGHVRVYQNVSGIWIQLGSDINGEASNDNSGYSVSLSDDGSTVAIGARKNNGSGLSAGHVRVYHITSGTWMQVGSDINGDAAGDESGYSVSLSGDGLVVAIGAPNNGGNGFYSGNVKTYQNIGNNWIQIGTTIYGLDAEHAGWSVSLSDDGTVLAMGVPYGGIFSQGYVNIYKNIAGNWSLIGSSIAGLQTDQTFGFVLTLSPDGNMIAITSNVFGDSQVRTYKNLSGTWTQVGSSFQNEAIGDAFGRSLALSADGNILAIGSSQKDSNGFYSGSVHVYRNISNNWVQIGSEIIGEAAGDYSGTSISLSNDGSFLAVGAPSNNGNGSDSGHVRVFDLSAILSSYSFVLNNFTLYPNPSNGIINISLENHLQLEKVNIYNQLGQLVKTAETNAINTMELAQGTYYMEVVTNQGKATKKIIVK